MMGTGRVHGVRWVGVLMVLTVAGFFLAWAILFGINLRARYRAQSLVVLVRSMKPGSTVLEDVRPMLQRYGAKNLASTYNPSNCRSADTGYSIELANNTVARLGWRFPFLRYVGLAPWGAGGEMFFDHGQLCFLRYSVGTVRSGPGQSIEPFEITTTESSTGERLYDIAGGRNRLHRYLVVDVPLNATPEERAHAFAFDTHCFTRMGGCRTLCEVLPIKPVWEDYLARTPGASIPADIQADPSCSSR